MKKILTLLIVGLIISSGLSACAFGKKKANLEILPTMETPSSAQNQVWVGTFQLIWNDLINELLKQPLEFIGTNSPIAESLNKQAFTTSDLSENSYYKKWGKTSPALKKEIEQGIKTKFNENSDILNNFDWSEAEGKYTLYAMLKKDFEYREPFNKLGKEPFKNKKNNVEYFGLKEKAPATVRNTIHVLFYNNENDFALEIPTKNNDMVILYRTNDNKTLDKYYDDLMKKYRISTTNPRFTKQDEFKAPYINFKSERSFDELSRKPIKNSNIMIDKAIETVEFKMDEKGVKLKSEAGMATMFTSLEPIEESRKFYFNNNYVIFLKEKEIPYFAMKVTDPKTLQK